MQSPKTKLVFYSYSIRTTNLSRYDGMAISIMTTKSSLLEHRSSQTDEFLYKLFENASNKSGILYFEMVAMK